MSVGYEIWVALAHIKSKGFGSETVPIAGGAYMYVAGRCRDSMHLQKRVSDFFRNQDYTLVELENADTSEGYSDKFLEIDDLEMIIKLAAQSDEIQFGVAHIYEHDDA